jgi:hypothetical protein
VCHCGAGTEVGSGVCYIKFGSVLPGDDTQIYFDSLLHACETFAKEQLWIIQMNFATIDPTFT